MKILIILIKKPGDGESMSYHTSVIMFTLQTWYCYVNYIPQYYYSLDICNMSIHLFIEYSHIYWTNENCPYISTN